MRLPTVRAKLTALVSLSAVVMLAALPVLSWLLHRQLVDEVDDRVTEAERAFQTELDDDLADLTLASRVLAADARDRCTPSSGTTPTRARQLAQVFLDVYPDIDVLLVEADGHVLAQVGLRAPARARRARSPSSPSWRAEGKEFQRRRRARLRVADVRRAAGVRHRPCRSRGVGGVVVCLPLDADYLKNASAKLGLELALAVVDSGTTARVVGADARTSPRGARRGAADATRRSSTRRDRSWAVARFEPRQLAGRARPRRDGRRARRDRHPAHRPAQPALRARRARRRRRSSRSASARGSRRSCRARSRA